MYVCIYAYMDTFIITSTSVKNCLSNLKFFYLNKLKTKIKIHFNSNTYNDAK